MERASLGCVQVGSVERQRQWKKRCVAGPEGKGGGVPGGGEEKALAVHLKVGCGKRKGGMWTDRWCGLIDLGEN